MPANSRWDLIRRLRVKVTIKGKKEVTGRRGRTGRQLLNDLNVTTGYCKMKKEELDRSLWGTPSGIVYGPVVRPTTE